MLKEENIKKIKIICDFDGTITFTDAVDLVLERFASPEWRAVEQLWVDGQITSRECTSRQIPMIQASQQELDEFIDTIPLVPGVEEFASFCLNNGLDLCIVSDGIDYVIDRVLKNCGLAGIPVMANRFHFTDEGYMLSYPMARKGCRFGMCKCSVAEAAGDNRIVLIGDSRSDTCIADKASFVYARRGFLLEDHCRKNNIKYTPYEDFFSIFERFKQSLQ